MLELKGKVLSPTEVDPSEHNVQRVNSIKELYPPWRQDSKAPTFALTYQGTFATLITNCGFTEKLAKSIEASYHDLYHVSDKWVNDKLEQACKDGYVTLAFGLRLRTPLLSQVFLGTKNTPREAAAEGRTAGNALGQSWCLLNTRASIEFMRTVRTGPHRLHIKPTSHIHDAQYHLIKNNMKVVRYVNHHLAKAVSWQEDPLIQNEHINMSGEMSIFYPNWANEMTIPNNASVEDIKKIITKHLSKLKD